MARPWRLLRVEGATVEGAQLRAPPQNRHKKSCFSPLTPPPHKHSFTPHPQKINSSAALAPAPAPAAPGAM